MTYISLAFAVPFRAISFVDCEQGHHGLVSRIGHMRRINVIRSSNLVAATSSSPCEHLLLRSSLVRHRGRRVVGRGPVLRRGGGRQGRARGRAAGRAARIRYLSALNGGTHLLLL